MKQITHPFAYVLCCLLSEAQQLELQRQQIAQSRQMLLQHELKDDQEKEAIVTEIVQERTRVEQMHQQAQQLLRI